MRRTGSISWILPDYYVQVVMDYEIDNSERNRLKPKRVSHIIIEVQHSKTVTIDDLK